MRGMSYKAFGGRPCTVNLWDTATLFFVAYANGAILASHMFKDIKEYRATWRPTTAQQQGARVLTEDG